MERSIFMKSIAAPLGLILFLTSIGLAISFAVPQRSKAAVVKSSSAFSLFEQRVKKPSSLSLAQATLVNRIDEMTPAEANLAVLHLENALKAYLQQSNE